MSEQLLSQVTDQATNPVEAKPESVPPPASTEPASTPSAADAAKEARAKAREAEKNLLVKSRAFASETKALSWAYIAQTFSLLGVFSLVSGSPLLNQLLAPELAPLAWALRGLGSVITGLLIVRAFILYHDHLHGALLARSKVARAIFWVFGALILAPVTVWRETHDYHHNNNAKIVGSHVGSYMMVTVEMWAELTPMQKLAYRITRHPITMVLGYFTIFGWGMCVSPLLRNFRKNIDSALSIVIHIATVAALTYAFGFAAPMMGFVLPLMVGCAAGSYLFYAQHNFPDMHVQPRHTWSYTRAALESSSFLETGPVLQWFTGNIGFHHVHHLNPAIPFYRLPEAMAAIPELQNPGRTSLWPRDVLACFKLKLWSPTEDRMVGYPPSVLASRPKMSETQPRWQRRLKRLARGARNALEVMRVGRLGAPYQATFTVVWQEAVYKLRHYAAQPRDGVVKCEAPLLLVPPLMVTSEIYDISPELSAVARLCEEGIDVWLVDFGAPEVEEGGMDRTLDDHVRAVSEAVDRVREATGKNVHLSGYSQGGMFAYQAAAYRRSEGIASLITFGSPVDIHRNLPAVGAATAERVIRTARSVLSVPLEKTESLPGSLTSTGFKLLSARKEIQQFADFVQKLHDRRALEQRERSRRFLAGEGFVAWPGPALRKFVDEFIVNNRMTSGGFIIDGRSVTLADIRTPVLYFVGSTDDIARPASVRAIQGAAPDAELSEVTIRAGHFGLVVGSKALTLTWPTVIDWIRWKEGAGERPALVPSNEEGEPPEPTAQDVEDATFEDEDFDIELFYEVATSAVDSVWNRLGDASKDVADVVDYLRWQMPRLVRLQRMDDTSRVSFGRLLTDQAAAIPLETFFLWKGRAFTYQDADQRVSNVVRGLIACGIKPGDRVAILMEGRPSYLTMACALSRLGAIAILLGADERRVKVSRALELSEATALVVDPENETRGRESFKGKILLLGGGGTQRTIDQGVIDMEAIDPAKVELPGWYTPNPGRAGDLAMIIFTAGEGEEPHAARVTNRRWAFSAIGAAAGCSLTSKDTVYCCLPLHHAAGMLVAVGGALAGGARFALSKRFSADEFWGEVRRYGASVVFYAGDMCRPLIEAPATIGEAKNPVRLFAGSGIRADVWQQLVERFGTGVLDFHASTEGNVVLANASGQKLGAVGRPIPGSAELALVVYDFEKRTLARGDDGLLLRCGADEPGVLISRVDARTLAKFDGYEDRATEERRLVRNAFAQGDAWFVSSDILRRDGDGDHWYVDRISDVVRSASGPVFTHPVEDVLFGAPGVSLAVVHALKQPGATYEIPVAVIVPRRGMALERADLSQYVNDKLAMWQRPRLIRVAHSVPMTDGFRPLKKRLQAEWDERSREGQLFTYDDATGHYV